MDGKTKFITFGIFLIIAILIFGAVSGYYFGTKASFFTFPVGMVVGALYTRYSMDKGWI